MEKRWLIVIPALLILSSCGTKEDTTRKKSTQSTIQQSITKSNKETVERESTQKESSEKETINDEKDSIAKLEDTSDATIYEEAYKEFTMQNNPKGIKQRGGVPVSQRTLHLSGLTQDEYSVIMWGINDYYGNLLENGSLDEEKINELRHKAMENLQNGVYAKREILPYEEVTLENAKSYAQQMIDKTIDIPEVLLIDPEIDSDGNFKVYYQTSPGTGGNGYIVITKDKIGRRYTSVDTQLGEAVQLE